MQTHFAPFVMFPLLKPPELNGGKYVFNALKYCQVCVVYVWIHSNAVMFDCGMC